MVPHVKENNPFGTPKIVSLVFEKEYVQEGCKGLNLNKRPRGLTVTRVSETLHFLSEGIIFGYQQAHHRILKKQAHGPHVSPEIQLQAINTLAQSYDYTIMLVLREKIHSLLFEK